VYIYVVHLPRFSIFSCAFPLGFNSVAIFGDLPFICFTWPNHRNVFVSKPSCTHQCLFYSTFILYLLQLHGIGMLLFRVHSLEDTDLSNAYFVILYDCTVMFIWLVFPMCAACFTHLMLLDLNTLKILTLFNKEYIL
jgi:hypothetical protein